MKATFYRILSFAGVICFLGFVGLSSLSLVSAAENNHLIAYAQRSVVSRFWDACLDALDPNRHLTVLPPPLAQAIREAHKIPDPIARDWATAQAVVEELHSHEMIANIVSANRRGRPVIIAYADDHPQLLFPDHGSIFYYDVADLLESHPQQTSFPQRLLGFFKTQKPEPGPTPPRRFRRDLKVFEQVCSEVMAITHWRVAPEKMVALATQLTAPELPPFTAFSIRELDILRRLAKVPQNVIDHPSVKSSYDPRLWEAISNLRKVLAASPQALAILDKGLRIRHRGELVVVMTPQLHELKLRLHTRQTTHTEFVEENRLRGFIKVPHRYNSAKLYMPPGPYLIDRPTRIAIFEKGNASLHFMEGILRGSINGAWSTLVVEDLPTGDLILIDSKLAGDFVYLPSPPPADE